MNRHVVSRLAPYWEGLLSSAEARGLEEHLARCFACAEASDQVRRGVAAARGLATAPMPEHVAARIRRAAAHAAEAPVVPRRHLSALVAAAAIGLVAAGGLLVWARSRPHVSLEAAAGEPAAFERLARAAHRRAFIEGEPLEIVSSDGAALREWARERTGVVPSLATRRSPEEERRYHLLGGRAVEGDGFTAAAIAFEVDESPVTLLVARDTDVPDAPRWGALGKRVRWRVDPETGAKMLTWTNSGQAYTLVSELRGGGQQACLVCHTDAKRRALIASLDAKLAPR